MLKNIFVALIGLLIGAGIGFAFVNYQTNASGPVKEIQKKQVIGFVPYWQVDQTQKDYSKYLTTLSYFSLKVDGNGQIVKKANPTQDDPGWYELSSGKLDQLFANEKKNNIKLSLVMASGDSDAINKLLNNPIQNADSLINAVKPIMKQYGFNDLNLDIEYLPAPSATQQTDFIQFVQTIKQQLVQQKLGTLTLEISPNGVITNNLINTQAIAPLADTIILMAYDYHSPPSFVTGPVAPLSGAGVDSEYDVTTAVEEALQTIPSGKLVLGMPLYGYEWETLNTAVRSAIIPGTGALASDSRMDSFLSSCADCSAFFDTEAQEEYVVYRDEETDTYHQIYFPDQSSVIAKINFANKEKLGGLALWALGYEGDIMLNPLESYK